MNPYLEDYEQGKDISEMKLEIKMPQRTKNKHPNQVLTDAIVEVVEDKNYKKWVMRVARSQRSANEILDLVETAKGLPEKYNRSGYIWNRL